MVAQVLTVSRLMSSKVLTTALVLLLAAAHLGAQGAQGQAAARHLVLISVDGLRPEYYLPGVDGTSAMPTLAALRAGGSWAEAVIGQYPSLTYPSHASIVTGVRPARHGVVQNTRMDPGSGAEGWYFDSSLLKVPALWNAASAAGLTTAALSWPVTVGAAIDYLIPETHQNPPDSTWLALARRQSTPGLVDAVVERLGGFERKDPVEYVERDRFMTAAAALVLERHRPNLLLLHLVEADGAQHASGPGSPEALAALARVDQRIGEIVEAAARAGIADRTAFLVTGDHGFYRVHSAFQPNVVLRDAGLLQVDGDGRIRSWQAIAHRAAIKLKDASDAGLARRVGQLFQDLADGPYRGLFTVVQRDAITRLGGDPDALLILEPVEGYTTAGGATGPFLVRSTRRGDHGYLPTSAAMHTGLVAWGAGIAEGRVVPITRQIDVAPTAARLLGFELKNIDGVPVVGILGAASAPRRSAPVVR